MKTRRQASEEKRQQRVRVIISAGLVLLMVFSTVGFYLDSTTSGNRYNGHKISPVSDPSGYAYAVKVDGAQRLFYSAPQDSLDIAVPPGLSTLLHNAQGLIFLFDPSDNQTAYYDRVRWDFQLALNPKPTGAALTQAPDPSSVYQFPVATCADATNDYPIMLLRAGERSLTFENGCYILQGTQQDLLLLRDRILYNYYGITEN